MVLNNVKIYVYYILYSVIKCICKILLFHILHKYKFKKKTLRNITIKTTYFFNGCDDFSHRFAVPEGFVELVISLFLLFRRLSFQCKFDRVCFNAPLLFLITSQILIHASETYVNDPVTRPQRMTMLGFEFRFVFGNIFLERGDLDMRGANYSLLIISFTGIIITNIFNNKTIIRSILFWKINITQSGLIVTNNPDICHLYFLHILETSFCRRL